MKPRLATKPIFLAAAGVVVASIVITYWIGHAALASEQTMARQLEVLKQLSDIGGLLKDTETGQRGYLLTGEEIYLEPYRRALSELNAQLGALKAMAAAGDLPTNQVVQVIEISRQKLEELEQTIQLRKDKGLDAALAIVRSDRGKVLMDRIRARLGDMEKQSRTDFADASHRSVQIRTLRTVIFFVVGFLDLAFLGWAYRRISIEMKQREIADQERARLAAIVESTDDAIISKNLDGIIASWNSGAEKLFGYAAAEILGKPMQTLIPPERANEEPVIIDRVKRGQSVDHFETVRLRKDGTRIDLSVTISPVRNAQGQIVAASQIARDITERKRAEHAVHESEERFRALVTASSDVIYRMSPDWSEMWHLRGRDFIADTEAPSGNWLQKYIPAKEQPRVLATIKEAIRTKGIFVLEHQVLRVDGGVGWTFSRAVPRLNGNGEIVEWFGAASDVTSRKHAEEKLQMQLSRLGLLSQTTRAIGERQDLKSIFQVVIRSVEDNLSVDFACISLYDGNSETLTVTCVGAKSISLALELALPEEARIPIDKNGLSRCVRGQLVYEPDISKIDFPFPQRLAKSGLRSVVFAPLLVESSVFGVLLAARREADSFSSTDCEFLQQLSEHVALAAHQAQLYNALQRAYDDLRLTQQAVLQQERLRALGQMASGIAHDINNALSPVAIYTETLLENEPQLSARGRSSLETIQRAIDDVTATVARMREFYRERETQLMLAPVNLNQMVEQVADLTRARWSDMPQQRGVMIQLRTDLASALPPVMGVENEIRDALTNLIFNGVDAMPNGGTLTLKTRFHPGMEKNGEATDQAVVQVEVGDTGVGMDEETRRRCLEPFYTTKGERGTGMGLAMVYGMVQRHSGDLEIESAIGRGTTVRLTFSVAVGSVKPEAPAASAAARQRLRILIVDDDPVLLKSLRDALELDGHHVTSANGGLEGIDAFRNAKREGQFFAAVITDLGMPRVDGRQVAKAIKAASPSTPVIMLTGWGRRLEAEGDIPEGVNQVLGKPPKLRELREALIKCCPPQT